MSFYLLGKPDEALKLKSFEATVRGAKAVVKITVETDDMSAMGFALQGLGEVQKGQRVKPSPRLALPAPGV